jgi:hypothetical protein
MAFFDAEMTLEKVVAELPVLEGERWEPVRRAPGYYVSTEGRIASCLQTSPRIIRTYQKRKRRVCVLRVNRNTETFPLELIVAETFIGPCPKSCRLGFKDGNSLNVRVSNIAFVPRINHLKQNGLPSRVAPSPRYKVLGKSIAAPVETKPEPAAKTESRPAFVDSGPRPIKIRLSTESYERLQLQSIKTQKTVSSIVDGLVRKSVPNYTISLAE